VSLSDLVTKTSGAAHLNSLFEVVSAFSTVGCQVKLPPTDPDCQTTPKASACNPACEQK
jgi:Trk-type K+ transport system membrane component